MSCQNLSAPEMNAFSVFFVQGSFKKKFFFLTNANNESEEVDDVH